MLGERQARWCVALHHEIWWAAADLVHLRFLDFVAVQWFVASVSLA